jgi:spore coat polysaccharide biosynthesis protein SpsF
MIVVLQGRIRSTRLPGKGFFTFFGQTLWERACDIALAIRGADKVIFASGDSSENCLIRPLVESKGVAFITGSEHNVLERYCRAIEDYPGKYLVRITCDNYLVQPEVVEKLYEATLGENADYGYVAPLSHYAGEVISCESLRRCYESGDYSSLAKEHVTWDIRSAPSYHSVKLPKNFLGVNHESSLTLDTVEDLIRLKELERDWPSLRPVRCLDILRQIVPAD